MPPSAPQLALHVDDLGLPLKAGLQAAARLRFPAVQVGASSGPMAPDALSDSGRRHLRRYLDALGLSLCSLRADTGGARFCDGALLDQHIHQTCRVLELARALDVTVVSAPVGRFRNDQPQSYRRVREALHAVAIHADALDRCFAIETQVDEVAALADLLRDLNCPNLRICYDPAELLMEGHDPLEPIERFADDIRSAHVRDAERGSRLQAGRETNLGSGHLNLRRYLDRLQDAGYHGPLILRRAHSANPASDVRVCRKVFDDVMAAGPSS